MATRRLEFMVLSMRQPVVSQCLRQTFACIALQRAGRPWRALGSRGLVLAILVLIVPGCGRFMARRLAQAPNTYGTWLAPKARVILQFGDRFLADCPERRAVVGPPEAVLNYRVVEPQDFGVTVTSTNWVERHRPYYRFTFQAKTPGKPLPKAAGPCGTIVLLHGFGDDLGSMVPWALRLAQDGWRCVLVDLRGHGRSTGKRIYYGVVEERDLSQLLDVLRREELQKAEPVVVLGVSYGAALALRWCAAESRVGLAVAIAPYAELSRAVRNIRDEYVSWFPRACVNAGLARLPQVLDVAAEELDPIRVLRGRDVEAFFVAGDCDRVTSVGDVTQLHNLAGSRSYLLVVPGATHEALPYFMPSIVPPLGTWLQEGMRPAAQ